MRSKWMLVVLTLGLTVGLAGCAVPIAELVQDVTSASMDPASNSEIEPVTPPALNLPNQGPAPELTNEVWINSEPLRLADLRGNVVIVEFWTYG